MTTAATAPLPPSKARAWVLAARPATLPAAVAPVLVGGAIAARAHHVAFLPFLAALVGAILIQIGANFSNDLFDFKKGADTVDRLGPTRVTQQGYVTEREVASATALTFGLATLVGIYLVAVGGWPIVAVGVASIVAALAYTGGPFPFGYYGLGDIFVFVFFGLVAVMGTYYVESLSLSWASFFAAIPSGLLITGILVVNNVRDVDTDRIAGKKTLAVRLGRQAVRVEYVACLVVAYLVPPLMWLAGTGSWLFWAPLLTVPMAVRLARVVMTRVEGPPLNGALKGTGLLQLFFAILFAASLLVP